MDPAKLMEVSLEGDFKDSFARKRWLGSGAKMSSHFDGPAHGAQDS